MGWRHKIDSHWYSTKYVSVGNLLVLSEGVVEEGIKVFALIILQYKEKIEL